jgi:hypothetical protein
MAGYKCTSIGCYSYQSPETNTIFQTLQARINQLLTAIDPSTPPIKIDGIIGKGTTSAALVILDYIAQTDTGTAGPGARSAYDSIGTPEQLAANAQFVNDVFALYTRSKGSTPATSTEPPTPQPSPMQLATTSANAPVKVSSPEAKALINNVKVRKSGLSTSLLDIIPPWLAYTSGGVLAVGTLVAIVVGAKRKKSGSSASAPAAVAGRWF